MATIRDLRAKLASGETTARQLVDDHLERIADPQGEGSRAFLQVNEIESRQVADGYDAIRSAGGSLPPFAGIPVAVKDLCDIAGQVTTAGSVVLSQDDPAVLDAPVVARLRAAGFIILGRTNMTEFAYSGLGLNSHYGTPSAPWGRGDRPRIPGGSSSGTAVAVADGMAAAGLGTDTGGSCRIPAAFCGVVGYKPTARRIPQQGIVPLSPSLDSVGPLGTSVDCCAILDDVFAGRSGLVAEDVRPPSQIRLAALSDFVLDDLDPEVAEQYSHSLTQLSAAGIQIVDVAFAELYQLPDINRGGGLVVAEAFAWHRELLAKAGTAYDQRVRVRIEPGANMSAAQYIEVLQRRAEMIEIASHRLAGFDAFVFPTVAMLPPTIESFADGDADYYSATNMACLRNTSVGNFLDACSISIPTMAEGEPPVGVLLMGPPLGDRELFQVARSIEQSLARDK